MKKIDIKKVLTFIGVFLIYIIPYLILPMDKEFYNSLNKINIPPFVYIIVWTGLYLLFSFYFVRILPHLNKTNLRLIVYTILNYIFNVGFYVSFFVLKQLFIPFVFCALSFLMIIFLWMETYILDKKSSYLLIPNIIWSGFATFLSLFIFLNN